MTGLTFEQYIKWRNDIKNQLENFDCAYKVICINPAQYYNFEDDSTYNSDKEVMDFDLYKVRHSDLIIVNFNSDKHSLGTMAELATAYERRIPIIGLNENNYNLHPWEREMLNKTFLGMNEMIEYVQEYYLT